MEAAALAGMNIAVAVPPGHEPGADSAAEVIDGPRSLVFQQAANRLPATQAVLYALLTSRPAGR